MRSTAGTMLDVRFADLKPGSSAAERLKSWGITDTQNSSAL
jgi:hypothetical protein